MSEGRSGRSEIFGVELKRLYLWESKPSESVEREGMCEGAV